MAETEQKVEMTGDMIEQVASTPAAGNWADRTSIGGYGELHYNNLDSKEEIDFHRFVLYFNHDFTDSIRLVSELELEHSIAGDGQNGEIELEQAYVEFDLNERNALRAGLFLMPVGILNETHEPPTFYGVERNPVERNIIPTTWWEGGADLHGELAPGFSYNLAVSSGLDVPQSGSRAFLIRSGRSKVSEARANDGAVTGRLKWTGMPGVELAATGAVPERRHPGRSQRQRHPVRSPRGYPSRALWSARAVCPLGSGQVRRDQRLRPGRHRSR